MLIRNFAFQIRRIKSFSKIRIGISTKSFCGYIPKISKKYSELTKLLANQLFEKIKSQEKNDICKTINLIMKQYEEYYDFRFLIENKDYLIEKLLDIDLAVNEQKQIDLFNLVKFLLLVNSSKCYETLLISQSLFEKNGDLDSKHIRNLIEFIFEITYEIQTEDFFKASFLLIQRKLRKLPSDFNELKYLEESFRYVCRMKQDLVNSRILEQAEDQKENEDLIESYFPPELHNKIRLEIMKNYGHYLKGDIDYSNFHRLISDDVTAVGNREICSYEFWQDYFALMDKHFEDFSDKRLLSVFKSYCDESQKIYRLENSLREKIKQKIKKLLDQGREDTKNTNTENHLNHFPINLHAENYLTFNMIIIDKEKDPNHFYESLEFLGKFYKQFVNYSQSALINNLLEYMNQLKFWAKSDLDLYKKDEPENNNFKVLFENICEHVCNKFCENFKNSPLKIKEDLIMFNGSTKSIEYPWHWARMIYFLKLDDYVFFLYKGLDYLRFDDGYDGSTSRLKEIEFEIKYKHYIEVGLIYAYYSDFYKKKHNKRIDPNKRINPNKLIKQIKPIMPIKPIRRINLNKRINPNRLIKQIKSIMPIKPIKRIKRSKPIKPIRRSKPIKDKVYINEKSLVKEIDSKFDEFNLRFKYAKSLSYLEDWVVNDLNNFELVSNELDYLWDYIRRCLNAQLYLINENNLTIYINLLSLLKKKNIESDLIIKRIEEVLIEEFTNKSKMSLTKLKEISQFFEAFGCNHETFAVEYEKFIKEKNYNNLI